MSSRDRDGGVTTAAGQAKQARLIELIIGGASVNEAAEEIGVSRRHAFRLISTPEARGEIARAARESAKAAQLVLQRGAEEAARSLVAMGTGKTKSTPARVAACKGVLDFVVERASQNLNVTAARVGVPSEFVGAAASVLERAIAEAERAVTVEQTVALQPAAACIAPVSAGLSGATEANPSTRDNGMASGGEE